MLARKGDALIEQQHENASYLQFDHFRQFPELVHGVFTRRGGVSEDVPSVTLWQIHSANSVTLRLEDEWRTDWAELSYYEHSWTPDTIRKGDALISQEPGVALALSFADCVPITFYDPSQKIIGMAHGGWRGTARGIVMATIEEMQKQFGSRPQDIYAGIAPAIGPCCYEVSQDVQDIFLGHTEFDEMPTAEIYRERVRTTAIFSTVHTEEKESLRLDLQTTNYQQLLMAGVDPAHIEIMRICTSCRTDLFFSHRREQGRTGRFVVIMALQDEDRLAREC